MSTNPNQLVNSFLKLAGASALVEITNNESLDMQLRKEASDRFDAISAMGRKDMDAALVKVAQEIYSEAQLHEIVAGKHTGEIMSKVAHILAFNDMSADELTKIAGAEGVAAKGVAGALSDAASDIQPTIAEDKAKTEGAGREYVGVLEGHEGDNKGKATGKAGGGIVGSMAGYNVINQPAKYDIEQTAAMIEEAVLAKQAAVETFNKADAFLKKYAHIVASK